MRSYIYIRTYTILYTLGHISLPGLLPVTPLPHFLPLIAVLSIPVNVAPHLLSDLAGSS
jgi:hypothetical protein